MAISQSEIASCLAEINNLSDDQLKELLNSETNEKYDQLVNQTDRVKNLEAERDMLMASVRSLAEFNLTRQPEYESDRSKLLGLVSESNHIVEQIKAKEATLLELTKRTSLQSTLSKVQAATHQAEEESEKIAKEFLENSIDYETFKNKYSEERKIAHSRRIKAERLRLETNESWTDSRTQSFGRHYQ